MSEPNFSLADYYKENRQDLSREVNTEQGLRLTIGYIEEAAYEKLRKSAEDVRNPEARRLAIQKKLQNLLAGAVLDWNMTPEIMARYINADTSKLPAEIPCEKAIVSDLLNLSDRFFGQVSLEAQDLMAFRAVQEREEQKN